MSQPQQIQPPSTVPLSSDSQGYPIEKPPQKPSAPRPTSPTVPPYNGIPSTPFMSTSTSNPMEFPIETPPQKPSAPRPTSPTVPPYNGVPSTPLAFMPTSDHDHYNTEKPPQKPSAPRPTSPTVPPHNQATLTDDWQHTERARIGLLALTLSEQAKPRSVKPPLPHQVPVLVRKYYSDAFIDHEDGRTGTLTVARPACCLMPPRNYLALNAGSSH